MSDSTNTIEWALSKARKEIKTAPDGGVWEVAYWYGFLPFRPRDYVGAHGNWEVVLNTAFLTGGRKARTHLNAFRQISS